MAHLIQQWGIDGEDRDDQRLIAFHKMIHQEANSLEIFEMDDLLLVLNFRRTAGTPKVTKHDVEEISIYINTRPDIDWLENEFRRWGPLIQIYHQEESRDFPENDITEDERREGYYDRENAMDLLALYVNHWEMATNSPDRELDQPGPSSENRPIDRDLSPSIASAEDRPIDRELSPSIASSENRPANIEEVKEMLKRVFPTGRVEGSPSPSSNDQLSLKSKSSSAPSDLSKSDGTNKTQWMMKELFRVFMMEVLKMLKSNVRG